MILVDTSVWIDHLRRSDAELARRLDAREVLTHPLVIGELAMGNLQDRRMLLRSLEGLPKATAARDEEVMAMIERDRLHGLGIGYVDAHLLAATRLTPDAQLWTRDRRLTQIAAHLGLT